MKLFKKTIDLLARGLVLCSALSGCGSSSGDGSNVRLEIIRPASDSSFAAGQVLVYELRAVNFTFAVPHDRRRGSLRDHPVVDEDSANHMADSEDHMHDPNETNPDAREGHYHVYLDDASGTDPHLTAWTSVGVYHLPENIQAGTHSLRFELRDNNHVPLGTPGSEVVLFFQVP